MNGQVYVKYSGKNYSQEGTLEEVPNDALQADIVQIIPYIDEKGNATSMRIDFSIYLGDALYFDNMLSLYRNDRNIRELEEKGFKGAIVANNITIGLNPFDMVVSSHEEMRTIISQIREYYTYPDEENKSTNAIRL